MCKCSKVIIGLVVVGFVILLILNCYFECPGLSSFPNWIMAIAAVSAFCYSLQEYKEYKRREKMETFSEYSARYSKDENIQKVVEYLIAYLENGNIEKYPISIYNKEMFLRFFEELQYQMDKDRIDKEDVEDFFVYYAVAAAMCEPFIQGTELANGGEAKKIWARYRKLISTYNYMEEGIRNDYKKHHSDSEELHILIEYQKN